MSASKNKHKHTEAPRKLTIQDLVFGIGRKVTDEEWELHLQETADEEDIYFTEKEVVSFVSKQLKKQREKINKSIGNKI